MSVLLDSALRKPKEISATLAKYLDTQIIRVTLQEICTTLDSEHRVAIITHFSCGKAVVLVFFFPIYLHA